MSSAKDKEDPNFVVVMWLIINGIVENFLKEYSDEFKKIFVDMLWLSYPRPITSYVQYNYWKELLDVLFCLRCSQYKFVKNLNFETLQTSGLHEFHKEIFKDGATWQLSKELSDKDFIAMLVGNMAISFFSRADCVSFIWGQGENLIMQIHFNPSDCSKVGEKAFVKKLSRKYEGVRRKIRDIMNAFFFKHRVGDTLSKHWPDADTWHWVYVISSYLSCDDIRFRPLLPFAKWYRFHLVCGLIEDEGIKKAYRRIIEGGFVTVSLENL